MTDMQWKSYLRGLIEDIEQALEINPDNQQLIKLVERLKQDLQG